MKYWKDQQWIGHTKVACCSSHTIESILFEMLLLMRGDQSGGNANQPSGSGVRPVLLRQPGGLERRTLLLLRGNV
jgi:hypothetical protein